MDWLIWFISTGGARRRDLVSWTTEGADLFSKIADEVAGTPGVKVVMQSKHFRRSYIFSGRRIAVAGHEDGIAVRLDADRKNSALQIPGSKLLTRSDGAVVKGMVAVPWSAHEYWRDLIHAALTP